MIENDNNKLISLRAASIITGYSPATIIKKSHAGDFPPAVTDKPALMFYLNEVLVWNINNRNRFIYFPDVCSILNRAKIDVVNLISLGIFPAPVSSMVPAENLNAFIWNCGDVIDWKQKFLW